MRLSTVYSGPILPLILLLTRPALAIPFALSAHLALRQSSLSALQLPPCALTCFLDSILEDGCASEADFACHCADGRLLGNAMVCLEQGCDEKDRDDAVAKVMRGCAVAGSESLGSVMGDVSSSSELSTTTRAVESTETLEGNTAQPLSTTSIRGMITAASSITMLSNTPAPTPSVSMSSPPASTSPPTASAAPPLGPLPPSAQLSSASKFGIAVSILVVALAIFLLLGYYIRRLKRELRAAQRAAALPNPASPIERGRRNWRDSPISPLSPSRMEEITTVIDNGYGVLNRKRGHVLSIVFEREEEDGMGMGVREPVPGQREGLSAPVELDGFGTEVCEMPGVGTPRKESRSRGSL